MLTALGLAIVGIGVMLTLLSPHTGLLFYWAWFLVRPQELTYGELGGYLPLERILALALIISLVVHHRLLRAKPFFPSRITWALAAFVAVNYLSIPTAVWRGGALDVANELGKTFIIYFCLINLITNLKELRRFLWVYVLGIGWEAASSLWAYGAHPFYAQGVQRAASLDATWGDPNTTATNLVLAIPILVALLKSTRGFAQRVVLFAFLALSVTCTVLTGSRNGIIILILVFFLLALWSSKRFVLVPALACLLVVGWFSIPEQYQHRYETIAGFAEDLKRPDAASRADESAYGRIVGFEVAMQMFLDRPILGVGAGQFAAAWRFPNTPYSYHGHKAWHQPHNLVGQLLSELGLFGGVSFGFYLATLLRQNRTVRRKLEALRSPPEWLIGLSKAIVVVVVALFVAGLSGHNLYRYNWYLAGGLVALLWRMAEQEKAAAQSSPAMPLATGEPDARD